MDVEYFVSTYTKGREEEKERWLNVFATAGIPKATFDSGTAAFTSFGTTLTAHYVVDGQCQIVFETSPDIPMIDSARARLDGDQLCFEDNGFEHQPGYCYVRGDA